MQDYKSGKTARSARQIEKELRLQIPLYILVLRDLLGLEPLGGVYRPLAGDRERARPAARPDAATTLPGFVKTDYLDDDEFWAQVEVAREKAAALAGRIRAGDVRHDPRGGACPSWCQLWAVCRVARVNDPLNAEQAAGVEARGVVFVSAGAGTGKTPVLVERFARAVCDEGSTSTRSSPSPTRKRAAGELRSRIRRSCVARGRHDLARALDGAWISTIHGFCGRLLRRTRSRPGSTRASASSTRRSRRCCAARPSRPRSTSSARSDDPTARLLATYTAPGCGAC